MNVPLPKLPPIINSSQQKTSNALKLLRLQFRGRYCLSFIANETDVCQMIFWSRDQALLASGTPKYLWDETDTDVFSLLIDPQVPVGYRLFAKQTRRGGISEVIVWGPDGLLKSVYPSVAAAIAASAKHLRSIEAA